MSVHSSGSGDGWLETLDVDQPHGLDYQEFNDIRIGTRLRMSQEHTAFADSTAGGIHKPGSVAVLGMEITDAAGDPTGAVVADGTYRARGLVWSYTVQAGANKGVLFCNTAAAGVSTAGDFTVLQMHPDLQWAGGDVTWQGNHSFAKDVSIADALYVDDSADFSDVFVEGDISINGDFAMDGSFVPTTCASDFGGFLDEDDLASDATAAVASQQSVKAYVDSAKFSAYTTEDADLAAMVKGTTYTATSDGFVSAKVQLTAGNNILTGTVAGVEVQRQELDDATNTFRSIFFAVASGETFVVNATVGTPDIFWKSIGTLSKPTK